MKVTPLGKYLRKLRIDNSEVLKDMADKLGVSSSALSAIELGRRNPNKGFTDELVRVYLLSSEEADELIHLAEISKTEARIGLRDASEEDRILITSFARKYDSLDLNTKKQIKELLGEFDID